MKRIKYDREVDILLIELNELPIDYAEEYDDMIIHFSNQNQPVLLEILGARKLSINMFDSMINNREVIFA